jgi:hypothetical protein
MKEKENFEDKLHERFEDFSVPLRDSQWDKMEHALLSKKRSKKRWWMMFLALVLAAGLGFAGGYLFQNTNKNFVESQTSAKTSISSPKQSKIAESKEGNNLSNIDSIAETNEALNNEISRIPSKNENRTKKQEVDSKSADQEKVASTNKLGNKKNELANDLPSKPNGYNAANQKGIYTLKPTLYNGEKVKLRTATPIELSSRSFALDKLKFIENYGRKASLPLAFNAPPYPKLDLPKQSLLSQFKAATSIQFTMGAFNARSSIAPNTNDSGQLINQLPGLEESIKNQIAKGSGVRFGLGFQTNVFKGLSVGSSLIYHQFSEKNSFEQIHNYVPFYDSSMQVVLGFIYYDDSLAEKSQVNIDNKISYLQIPLRFRFDKAILTNLMVGVSASYAFNVPLKMDYAYFNLFQFKYEKLNKEMFQLGAQKEFGLHFDYRIWKKTWLGLNYEFATSTNSFRFLGSKMDLSNRNYRINLGLRIEL